MKEKRKMENEKNKYEPHPTEPVDYSYVDERLEKAFRKSYEEYERVMSGEDTHRLVRKTDSIVDDVVDKFISRASFGKQKYNNTMDRTDLTIEQWLDHAIEEHMDAILYLNKLKKELHGKV